MTSLPVKDIGAVMSRTAAASGTATTTQSTSSVSFESVFNNQTEKNSSPEPAAEETKPVRKEDDTITRDSLKSKDAHKNVVKQEENVEETPKDDIRNMSPEEWEEAMEVLGAAAVEMIQQIADTFGMTVEEVQGLMSQLGMEQLDVLQQESLGQLILAAGGADSTASLLTNEELYQQYQALMEQLNGLLEETGETLKFDVEQLVQMAVETNDDVAAENPFIEVTVEEDMDVAQAEEPVGKVVTNRQENPIGNVEAETQTGNQAQSDTRQDVAENKAQGENLVLQNLKTESFEPQLQQLSQTVSAWDADTLDIMKQIMDYMKIQIKPDMSNLEMQLHPESLGTLQIHVASKGGNITAQFVTQNETVKAALESQMIQLKESFAEQGVKVDAIEVTVQTHQFEQNLEQGRGRQQNETERRARTRRIQLDGPLTLDDLNAMEAEEQLAAEMMAASGNTVDYTA